VVHARVARKRIGGRLVHEIVVVHPRLDHAREEAPRIRQIAFAGERPPREARAEAAEQRTHHRLLSKALDRQRAAADADQPARERELLARAVPPTLVPDAGRGAVSREVQSFTVRSLSHGAELMQIPRQPWSRKPC
jgi:hypothetical protein